MTEVLLDTIEIEIEDPLVLLDDSYLGSVVGWSNFNHPDTLFLLKEKVTWYYYSENYLAIPFTFDKVRIVGFHGYGGTSYLARFLCNDVFVPTGSLENIAPTVKLLQEKLLARANQEVLFITEKRIPALEKEIQNIKDLQYDEN